jgi:hypothetical protein
MAVIITKPVTEQYDVNVTDNSGGQNVLGLALAADPEAARLFAPRPLTFSAEFTALGDEAQTLAALQPVNLTGLGVLFPAGTMRNIRTRCWSKRAAATNAGYVERVTVVQGGAPPTLPALVTLAGSLDNGSNDNRAIVQTNNLNSAPGAPQYGAGVVSLDGTNVIVGFQNFLGSTGAVTATVGCRVRLEVIVDPLVVIPVFV